MSVSSGEAAIPRHGRARGQSCAKLLQRLLGFPERDPANPSLLADAAQTAFDEEAFDMADSLLDRYAAIEPLPPPLGTLKGLVALAQRRFADASAVFRELLGESGNSP